MSSGTTVPLSCESSIHHAVLSIENIDTSEKPMSEEKKDLLKEMDPLVKQILDCCDGRAIEQLVKLNEKMMEVNVKEDMFLVEHCVPVRHLVGANRKRTCLVETMQRSLGSIEDLKQAETARNELQMLQSRLRTYMTELMLPPSWTIQIPNVIIHQPAGRRQLSNANRQTRNPPTAAGNSTDQSSGAMDTTHNWVPGETIRGEKILAFRPVKMTGTLVTTGQTAQMYGSIKFVVEQEGKPNPIIIADETRVGSAAVEAYLALPANKKCDITRVDRNYGRMDGNKFGKIKGVARDPNASTNSILPWTVVLVEFDRETRLVNRTALRNAKKERIADGAINDFLISVGEEPDAPKQVRQLRNAENRLQLDRLLLNGSRGDWSPRFRTGVPRMLGDQEECYHSLNEYDFPSTGRTGMPANSQGPRPRHLAWDTPYELHRPTSARARGQGPTPAPRTAPAQPSSRTSTTNARPDEQNQTSAAADEQPVTRTEMNDKMDALMRLVEQLTVQLGNQQSGAARP